MKGWVWDPWLAQIAGLDKNLCRNPDNSEEPFCYVQVIAAKHSQMMEGGRIGGAEKGRERDGWTREVRGGRKCRDDSGQ